jgi:hypothetical protein
MTSDICLTLFRDSANHLGKQGDFDASLRSGSATGSWQLGVHPNASAVRCGQWSLLNVSHVRTMLLPEKGRCREYYLNTGPSVRSGPMRQTAIESQSGVRRRSTMIAKMRMQVGDAVISWGVLPEASSADAQNSCRPARLKFAVIEGGRKLPSTAPDVALPLHAKSA